MIKIYFSLCANNSYSFFLLLITKQETDHDNFKSYKCNKFVLSL